MVAQVANLVWETSVTTGTGNLTTARNGGYQRGSEAFGTGDDGADNPYIFIVNRDAAAAEWEICPAHWSAASTLVRGTPILSSNANAAVNFGAGTKDITNDIPASFQAPLYTALAGIFPITAYGALADVLFRTDGVTTATDQTVTSATGGFTGKAGKTIIVEDALVNGTPGTFTVTIASPAVFTKAGHGFEFADTVIFTTTGALPTGLTAGTRYYVRNEAADTFQVSTAKGGTSVNTSGTQSGTHTVTEALQLVTTILSVNSDTSVELTATPGITGTARKIQFGTNSTTAINDAIDAAVAAGGGWVYVPPIGVFQAINIDLAHKGGIKFGGLVWGVNAGPSALAGVGLASIIVPSGTGNLLDLVGSVQMRIEDIQLGDTRSPVLGTNAILIADSTTRTGDSYELRNLFVTGMWAAAALYNYGCPIDIEHCRFWNYAGTATAWAAILTRDNVFSQASTNQTIATATTGNPNCSVHDTEFHNFTGLETPLGAVRLRGAIGVTFHTCLFDSADLVDGTMLLETAGSAANTVAVHDCTFYSESAGPVVNAASITCNTNSTWYETGENTYTAVTKVNGSATLTYNSGIVPAAKVLGTPNNSTPPAGYIGQVISSTVATGSAVSLTNGTQTNITSITLTPGIWDVRALLVFTGGATTEVKYIIGSITLVSATLDSSPGRRNDIFYSSSSSVAIFANGNTPSAAIPDIRLEVAADTPVYLLALPEFDTSTMGGAGRLSATRVG